MTEWILRWISLFETKTRIAGKFTLEETTWELVFLVFGILLVFAGIKLFRLLSSFLMFSATAIVLCTFMNGRANWGAIVTAFTIIGCLFAYMVFNWKVADAIVISSLTAAAIAWKVYPVWWAALLVGAAVGIFVGNFPLIGITASTAVAGVTILMEGALRDGSPFIPVLAVFAGFGVQFFLIGRKQKLFARTMPAKLKHRLERRRR
ncbi:MAG: hypothetical protein Q4E89_01015 [Eubacteriales bacterium]|nr:hypothetical protein [Eubacteriales bacterium]